MATITAPDRAFRYVTAPILLPNRTWPLVEVIALNPDGGPQATL